VLNFLVEANLEEDDKTIIELYEDVLKVKHETLIHLLDQLEFLRDKYYFHLAVKYDNNDNVIKFIEQILIIRLDISHDIYGIL